MQISEASRVPAILAIGLPDHECTLIRTGAASSGWKTREVRTYREGILRLCREETSVIVCSTVLSDGTWEDILSATATQVVRPRVIVGGPRANDRLWAEVLNLGGFDVLEFPFKEREIVRCLEMACRNWLDEVRSENWKTGAATAGAG